MADLLHQAGIQASPNALYKALMEAEGLKGWWSEHSVVEDSVASVSFYNNMVTFKLRVSEAVPNTQYAVTGALAEGPTYFWRVTAEDEHGASTTAYSAIWSFSIDTSNTSPTIPAVTFPVDGTEISTLSRSSQTGFMVAKLATGSESILIVVLLAISCYTAPIQWHEHLNCHCCMLQNTTKFETLSIPHYHNKNSVQYLCS